MIDDGNKIKFCKICHMWERSLAHGSPSDCSYWLDNSEKVKEYNKN